MNKKCSSLAWLSIIYNNSNNKKYNKSKAKNTKNKRKIKKNYKIIKRKDGE